MEPCGTPWLPGNGGELDALMKTGVCRIGGTRRDADAVYYLKFYCNLCNNY